MSETEAPTVKAVPSLAERIRELLPDHARVFTPFLPGMGDTTWCWSTPDAIWTIRKPGGGFAPVVVGNFVELTAEPGGSWSIVGDPDAILRRLAGVLRALDAIGGDGRD